MKALRATISALAFCMVFSISAQAQTAGGENAEADRANGTTEAAPIPARVSARAAEELLRKRVDSIDWIDKPFEEVIEWLRENGENRVNIVPRWGPLGVENVNRESLVTLQLNNTNVADVLNETLDQLSEDGEIRYRGIENKLTLSTRQDFERKMYTKTYDVTDMMFRVPDFGRGAPQIDLQRAGQQSGGGSGGGGGSGQGAFSGQGGGQQDDEQQSGQQGEQEMEMRLGKLRDLIQSSIAPESWDTTNQQGRGGAGQTTGGGGRGRIEIFNRALVVTNTIEVHEMIAGQFRFGS